MLALAGNIDPLAWRFKMPLYYRVVEELRRLGEEARVTAPF